MLFIDNRINPQGSAIRMVLPMAPQQTQLGRTLFLVIQDERLGIFRNSHLIGSALLEHIRLQPSLKPICELFTSAGNVVFSSQGVTLGHPLVLGNVGLVHDKLALSDRGKRQIPEIAVDDVLKASTNQRHFFEGRHVGPQPERNTHNKYNKLSKYSKTKLSKISKISKISNISIIHLVDEVLSTPPEQRQKHTSAFSGRVPFYLMAGVQPVEA